ELAAQVLARAGREQQRDAAADDRAHHQPLHRGHDIVHTGLAALQTDRVQHVVGGADRCLQNVHHGLSRSRCVAFIHRSVAPCPLPDSSGGSMCATNESTSGANAAATPTRRLLAITRAAKRVNSPPPRTKPTPATTASV